MKAAADLIVHAAVSHLVERQRCHVQGMRFIGAVMISTKEIDAHAGRKLWRVSKPAFPRVESRFESAVSKVQQVRIDLGVFGLLQLLPVQMFEKAL